MKLKLLLLLSLLFPSKVFSQLQVDTIIQDNVLYTLYSSENGSLHAEASKYNGYYSECLSLPHEIQKDNKVYPLTAIGDSAFLSCGVRSIIIPEPVCSIGQYAFACPNGYTLESVKLPSSLIHIGNHAFSNSGILKIDIPESVTTIGEYAFWGCYSLGLINLPSTLKSIGDYAFDNCYNISVINYNTTNPISANKNIFQYQYINATNTYYQATLNVSSGGLDKAKSTSPWKNFRTIKEKNFSTPMIIDNIEYSIPLSGNYCQVSGCKICDPTDLELPETILIDNKEYIVDAIAPYAFAECEYLSSIVIPESVTNIGNGAFSNCQNLEAVAILNPYIPIYIGSYAFYKCHNLKQIYSVSGCNYIGEYAFSEVNIKSITIAENGSLGDNAFALANIGTLNLFSNVSFRSNPFGGCGIGTINYNTKELVKEWQYLFDEQIYEGTTLNIPYGMLEEAYNTEPWMYFKNITETDFPNPNAIMRENGLVYTYNSYGLTVCGIYSSIRDVVIPEKVNYSTVTGIDNNAFEDCFFIKSMTLCQSTKYIGDCAFLGCSQLSSINIPTSVTYIGKQAFSHCSSLSHIEIPNSIQSISDFAFECCYNLTSIKIPESVTYIGRGAFQVCSSLDSIKLPPTITIIEDGVFNICQSLSHIELPNSITHIGYMAFSECHNLKSINFPNTVTHIGYSAFSGCQNLKSIKFPDQLKSIDWNAFAGCKSIENVILPANVEAINSGVFQGCTNLTSVELPCNIKDLGTHIFYNCNSLRLIVIN